MTNPRLQLGARFLVAWLAFSGASVARGSGEEPRPRIGLVLSGGGARGAAHIGVLSVLEELRIPVDFVVGTSMGAIIGGLYATGYSPDEMAGIIETADWGSLLSDEAPREQLWFRRRQDQVRFRVDMELGWRDGGPVLPPGLILGRNVESFLEQLTLPVAGVQDFDDLRVPFRCVATDLADGSIVVFDRGSLPLAIRASMSLPGIFAPVEHEGRLLVDGGAVDNIPIDVARELGADVLILIDISTPLGQVSASPLGVSNQVVGILMDHNRTRAMAELGEGDVAITPDLGNVTTLGFARASRAIEIGREATLAASDRLAALGVSEEEWGEFLARQRKESFSPPTVRHLTIDRQTVLSERVLRRFSTIREGRPLDANTLETTRENLAGLGLFESIEVEAEPVPGSPGRVDVVLRVFEKSWGPDYVRFGLGISSDLAGEGDFDFGVQHTSRPLNALGGEWRNEVQIGTRTRLYTEFFQPLDAGLRWFVAPALEFDQDNVPIVVDGDKVAEINAEIFSATLDVGRHLGSFGEVRARYGWLEGKIRPEVALPGLLPSKIEVDSGILSTRLLVDTLDSISFPTRGGIGFLEWRFSEEGLDEGKDRSTLEGGVGVPLTLDPLTVFASAQGGATFEGHQSIGGAFTLGGFRQLSGLAPGSLSGNYYGIVSMQPYVRLDDRSLFLGLAQYAGLSLEYGGVWQDSDDYDADDLLFSSSVFLGFDSFLGPAHFGVGFTEGGERSAYVFLGPVF